MDAELSRVSFLVVAGISCDEFGFLVLDDKGCCISVSVGVDFFEDFVVRSDGVCEIFRWRTFRFVVGRFWKRFLVVVFANWFGAVAHFASSTLRKVRPDVVLCLWVNHSVVFAASTFS